jgi:hypothetical protein
MLQLMAAQQQNSTDTNTNSPKSNYQIDIFQVKGQISSLASDLFSGKSNSKDNEIWILGDNWNFSVQKGNVSDFFTNIIMTKIDGTGAHIHNIDKLNNTTGVLNPLNSSQNNKKIILDGNYTKFSGIAAITVNGNVKWKDVPVSVYLINGNTIALDINPSKANYHFKGLPIFGIVTSIIDTNGKEMINR